jgi:hypothetical protein
MVITYNKQYTEQKFKHFNLYSNLSFKSTNVFWEYYNLILSFSSATQEEITEKIRTYKKESRSKLRISFREDGVEFYKTDKFIFPEFYILFKN